LFADGAFEGPLHLTRQLDRNEVLFWEQIVFARLVHDPNEPLGPGIFVAQRLVDLPTVKGNFIPVVFDADEGLRM
jgi:hypothetical protein